MAFHPDWLIPDWPAPARVRSVFTTRAGGISKAPYDSLNLGRPSADAPSDVDVNRARLQVALGHAPVFMQQVHGVHSAELRTSPERDAMPSIQADACVTVQSAVVCAVRVADCLPVLFADSQGAGVAAAHAGWRGLAAGVLENNFRHFEALCMRTVGPSRGTTASGFASRTLAWLGPCIGPQAFEVGSDVREVFVAQDASATRFFQAKAGDKWLADLPGLARARLRAIGVSRIYGNDGSSAWCTVANPLRFFSHRRDSVRLGGSGRMAACIWID